MSDFRTFADDFISRLSGQRKLNEGSPEVQGYINDLTTWFSEQVVRPPVAFSRYGMLSEVVSRLPVYVYDLPYFRRKFPTAFTDGLRIYFNADFVRLLVKETDGIRQGMIDQAGRLFTSRGWSANPQDFEIDLTAFVLAHEAEHCRRKHFARMLDCPVANQATDARINGDLLWTMISESIRDCGYTGQIEIKDIAFMAEALNELSPVIGNAYGTKPDEIIKWFGVSEEEIGAQMMREQKVQPQQPPGGKLDFDALCRGVIAEAKHVNTSPAKYPGLATAMARIEKDAEILRTQKSKMPAAAKGDLMNDLSEALLTTDIQIRNLEHSQSPVSCGDPMVDQMTPSNKLELLLMVLDASKKQDISEDEALSGIDIEGEGLDGEGDDHETTPEEMAGELNKRLPDVAEKLGYNDLLNETADAKASVGAAINAAEKGAKKNSGIYPGEHMVDYAIVQKNGTFRRRLTWQTMMKDLSFSHGKFFERDMFTPTIASMSAMMSPEDFGYASEDDVIQEGAFMPCDSERNIVAFIIDTSGSVFMTVGKDGVPLINLLVSDAIQAAKSNEMTPGAPEVYILPADTICRGEPVHIHEGNVDQYISEGLDVGGGGGTNLTAALQNVLAWTQPGGKLSGRTIDAIVYATDSYDAPPSRAAVEKMVGDGQFPNVFWVVPDCCYQDKFYKAVKDWSNYVSFNVDAEAVVDLTKQAPAVSGLSGARP